MSEKRNLIRGTIGGEPVIYGQSVSGIPMEIWMPSTGNIETLIMAGHHGDEAEGPVLISYALRSMNLNDLKCAVIVTANPDGLRCGTRANLNGVDLNRNWPASNWSPELIRYDKGPNNLDNLELSPGSEPASEPETRALLELLADLNPKLVISIHSALGCIDDPHSTPSAKWLAEKTGLPLVPDVGYPTLGSFGSWALENDLELITWELPKASMHELKVKYSPALRDILTGSHLT